MSDVSTSAKQASKRSTTTKATKPTSAKDASVDGQEILAAASEAALAAASTGDLASLTYSTAKATDAEITDELEKGGPAFGSFVKSVGLAVAESQAALDANLRETAKMLSEQSIKVVAIYEQQLKDDDGTMDKGNPIIQELPLINYLMPTAYQWSRVHLEAEMKVSEFNTANGFNIKSSSNTFGASVGGGYGLMQGGWNASGRLSYGHSSSQVAGEVSSSVDSAAGTLHMEATLEPRADIRLPQPFVIQKGPRLKVTVNSVDPIMSSAEPPAEIGRKAVYDVVLTKSNGEAHTGKTVDVRCDQPLLDVSVSGNTDSNGKATVTVRRQGGAWQPGTSMQAMLRVSFGLVTETVALQL